MAQKVLESRERYQKLQFNFRNFVTEVTNSAFEASIT